MGDIPTCKRYSPDTKYSVTDTGVEVVTLTVGG